MATNTEEVLVSPYYGAANISFMNFVFKDSAMF